MRGSHLSLSAIFSTLLLSQTALSEDKNAPRPCTVYNTANGNFYDLSKIAVQPLQNHRKAHKDDRIESWHARGYDYGTNFTVNFCQPVIESLENVIGIPETLTKNISAFYKIGEETYSIGQSSARPVFRGRKLTLNYTDGSPCDETSSRISARKLNGHDDKDDEDDDDENDDDDKKKHKNEDDDKHKSHKGSSPKSAVRRKSTLISFLCDRESLDSKVHLSFVGASPDECSYFFEARTSAACGGAVATQQSLGPGGVFGVIALIAAAVYLLGGIAYQRTVMHQRGWRQLPNYALWAGIFGFLNDIFVIFTSSCARIIPRRKGYNQLPSGIRSRRDDEAANGLIDSYEEEY